ncbi:uncharacterized protein LOC143025593 isoform X2 [Oratosquilla oratoria]|uniref:uncharacterized protein LOC143025593 isoform X2 n=1 Tax=Oratosquilla oratoria TaxID=337810 RepID=UPI003F75A8E7
MSETQNMEQEPKGSNSVETLCDMSHSHQSHKKQTQMSEAKWKMEKANTHCSNFHHVNAKSCPFGTIPKATREKSVPHENQGSKCKNGCGQDVASTVTDPSLQEARNTQLKILEYLRIVVENQRTFERQITSKVQHLESKNAELQKDVKEICRRSEPCVTSAKHENRTNKLSELEPDQKQDINWKIEEAMRVQAKQFEQMRQNNKAKQTKEVKETEEQQQTTEVKETEEQQQTTEIKETEEQQQTKEVKETEEQQQAKEARDAKMSQTNCVVPELSENMSKKDDVNSWLIINREFMVEQVGALPEAEELQNHQCCQKSVASTESTCSSEVRQHLEGCEESCKGPHAYYSISDFILEDTSSASSSGDFDQMSSELYHLAGVALALTSPNQKWTIQTEKKDAKKKEEEEGTEKVSESEDSSSCLSLSEVVETKESELLEAQFKLKELQALAEIINELLTETLLLKESTVLIPQCSKSPIQTQNLHNQEMKIQNSEIQMQTTQILKRETEMLMKLGSQAESLQEQATQISQILGNQAQNFQDQGTQISQISESQTQQLVGPDTQVTDIQVFQISGKLSQVQEPAHTTKAAETEGVEAQVSEGTEHPTKISENPETQVQVSLKMDNKSQVSQNPKEQVQISQALEGQDQASKIPENQTKALSSKNPEMQAQALHPPESQGKVVQSTQTQTLESPEKQAQALHPLESQGKVMQATQAQILESPEKQGQASYPPEIQGKVMQMKPSQIQEPPESLGQALHPPENQGKAVQTKDSQTKKLSEKQTQILYGVLCPGKLMHSQSQESPEKQTQAPHPPDSQGKVMQDTQSQTQESETHRLHFNTPSQTSQTQVLQTPNLIQNSQTPKIQPQSTQYPENQSWTHEIQNHPQYTQGQSPYKPRHQSHYKSGYVQWQPRYQHQVPVLPPAGNPPAVQSQNHYEPWEILHQGPKSTVTPHPGSQGLAQPPQSQVPVSQSGIVYGTTSQNHHEPWEMFHSSKPDHPYHGPQPDHSRGQSLAQPTQSPQSRVANATTSGNHHDPWGTYHRPQPDHSRGQSQAQPPQPPHPQLVRSPGVLPVDGELVRDVARAKDPCHHITGPIVPQNPVIETKRQCPFCNLLFQVTTSSAQKLFEDHVEDHLGYVCPICSLAFKRQDLKKYLEHTGSHNYI